MRTDMDTQPMSNRTVNPASWHAQHASQKLGASLVEQGLISVDQLTIALIEQRQHGHLLGQQLVRLGFLTDALLRDILAQRLSQESIDLQQMVPDAELLAQIPQPLARRLRVVPLSLQTQPWQLVVAAIAPLTPADIDQLRAQMQLSQTARQLTVKTLLATESDIEQALDRCYGHVLSLEGILREIEQRDGNTGLEKVLSQNENLLPGLAAETAIDHNTHSTLGFGTAPMSGQLDVRPVIRLVDAILVDAVKQGASDIHFEPEHGYVRIRYRVDGVLVQIRSLHGDHWPAMCVRLKIMAGMDIAEQRSSQDGRMQWYLGGRDIDFRVSSHPTLHGENMVLRVLDRKKAIVPLTRLGLPEAQLALLYRMLEKPEGLIIVTGPTGSGKTTTLYSMLTHLNQPEVNIMTLEDPVEYPVQRMRQTSVNQANKVDFASGIRAILRQDPDIILIGEVRDEDTAAMAIRAAMTGHLVMTTLHCNRAVGAFARLQDLGVSLSLLNDTLIGVIGQRLLRRLCPHCKTSDQQSHALNALWPTLAPAEYDTPLYQPIGCVHCHQRGYRGRFAILEMLAPGHGLHTFAATEQIDTGLVTKLVPSDHPGLAEAGLRAVMAGDTSLHELKRVVDLSALSTHLA